MQNKDKKINNKVKRNGEIIDLTRFISPESVKYDPNGMYTGTTAETLYGEELDEPIQDADDL